MPDKTYDLSGYVTVPERIAKFYELFGQGRLVTDEVQLTTEPDGVPRVMVRALAYRDAEDAHPGVGYSWMVLPGTTNFTRGSELENTETSAWGRAIASLGILTVGGIATNQEVEAKGDDGTRVLTAKSFSKPIGDEDLTTKRAEPAPDRTLPIEFDGKVSFGGGSPNDGNLRIDVNKVPFLGFKVTSHDGKVTIPQVVAKGPIADLLANEKLAGRLEEGSTVTVWGDIERVEWKKDGKKMPSFQRLTIARIQTAEVTIPSPIAAPFTKADAAEVDSLFGAPESVR